MITIFTGTPGSYKSFHAVKYALNWLRSGRNLICNFPLDYTKKLKNEPKGIYKFIRDSDLNVNYLINFAVENHFSSFKTQTLVVIDEASLKFNSRSFMNADRIKWINFLANHRHFNYDFILICQSDKMIDKQIRCLVETEIKHRDLKNYKFFGRLLNLIFHGCFLSIEYWYPCQLKNTSEFCIFNKKIASCYDTMALFVDSPLEKN